MTKKAIKDFILSRFLLDVLIDVIIVFLLVLLIRSYLFAPFRVHGPSMCDTFNIFNEECFNGDGEYVLISRLSTWSIFGFGLTEIERGDVVIFEAPESENGDYFIKRVIGVGGDTLKIEGGHVYLMNESGDYVQLEEPYLNEVNQGNTQAYRTDTATYEVPEGSYFVLGDNRVKSSDSRRCFKQAGCDSEGSPFLEYEKIEGEVTVVIFPITHFRLIPGVEYSI